MSAGRFFLFTKCYLFTRYSYTIAYMFGNISCKQSAFQNYFLCLRDSYAYNTSGSITSEKHIHIFFSTNFQNSPLAFTQIQIIWRKEDLKNLSNIIIECSSPPSDGIGSVVIFETRLHEYTVLEFFKYFKIFSFYEHG